MTSPTRRDFLSTCLALALPLATRAQPAVRAYDLVIRGGIVLDPARGLQARTDVGIRSGRIAAIDDLSGAPAARTLAAEGRWVVPGLVDLQLRGHPRKSGAGFAADDHARTSGVVTWVSAGDLDAEDVVAFRRDARLAGRSSKAYAFLNFDRRTAPRDSAGHRTLARALAEQHDVVLGLMLRFDDRSSREPRALLDAAVELIRHAGTRARILCPLPLPASGALDALLAGLRPGDLVSGLYAGGHGLIRDGHPHAGLVEARRRGVLFDADGRSRFDARIARTALAQGLMPDVISSAADVAPDPTPRAAARRILDVMGDFLDLGLDLDQVIAMATSHPARVIGRDPHLGTLAPDTVANVTMLDIERRAGTPTRITAVATLHNGTVLRIAPSPMP